MAGSLVIFSEGFEESLAGFASVSELVGCWGLVWVPEWKLVLLQNERTRHAL
jgi:hypothetical protein